MQESLVLFESVINSRWFLRTSVILFLNKIDVFKMKLPKAPLERYFPEYTGGPDINKAAKYILWRFTQTNRARLSIYPHLTQATDTSNVSGCSDTTRMRDMELIMVVYECHRSDWYLLRSRRLSCRTRSEIVVSYKDVPVSENTNRGSLSLWTHSPPAGASIWHVSRPVFFCHSSLVLPIVRATGNEPIAHTLKPFLCSPNEM